MNCAICAPREETWAILLVLVVENGTCFGLCEDCAAKLGRVLHQRTKEALRFPPPPENTAEC